jgi:hypothetical protein
MINSVRNTVLAIANKQNFGYISPADFNLYAKQAQLDIFEDYFYRYNNWVLKQNARMSGSDYADLVKNITEVIDSFLVNVEIEPLVGAQNKFPTPSDYYTINVLRAPGSAIVDKVSNVRFMMLENSNLTSPTIEYPMYCQKEIILNGDRIEVFDVLPGGIDEVYCDYIRKPLDPKWTYVSLQNGEPMFDQSASDYQDFELPHTDEPLIISKILQYVGISIREKDVYTAAQNDEIQEQQRQR